MRHSLLVNTKPSRAVEALQELQESLGWNLVMAMCEDDILDAAAGMGDNPNMPNDEIHYRRGMIKATSNIKLLPLKLENYFQNQAILESAKEK